MQKLAEFLDKGVDAQIEPWNIASNVIYMEHVVEAPINWKLVIDGARAAAAGLGMQIP